MLTLQKRAESVRVVLKEAEGDDPESFVVLDPITPKMRRRAIRAVKLMLEHQNVDPQDIDVDLLGDAGELVSRELMRMGMTEWGGIGDEDRKPVDLTPDQATRLRTANDPDRPTGTIDALLDDDQIFDRIDAEYVLPDAKRRAEKNGLSGSPNGTSEAATPGSDIANSPAKPKRRAAAKNARIARKRSKPKPAKASGRS